jgi:hypothetical protein
VANQYYQFTFDFTPSLTTSFQTQGATGWTTYQEPNYNRGQVRAGGPNNPNNPNGPGGSYLVVNVGDTVFINLVGPQDWKLADETAVNVIVSQANSPAQGQGYSPFANSTVYYALTGSMLSDGVTLQCQVPDTIQANPGPNNWGRYELTIAFTADDGSGNLHKFGDDPEMDVQGS